MTTTSIDSQLCVEDEFDDVHPWRRYFARHTDVCFIIVLCIALYNLFPNYFHVYSQFVKNKEYINYLVIIIVIMFINAVFISLMGTTLGKFLFGIRVVSSNDKRLKFSQAFYREFLIVMMGLAFYIPIINFFTLYFSHTRLITTGKTKWDNLLNCCVVHQHNNIKQKIYRIFGAMLYVFLSLLVHIIIRHLCASI